MVNCTPYAVLIIVPQLMAMLKISINLLLCTMFLFNLYYHKKVRFMVGCLVYDDDWE